MRFLQRISDYMTLSPHFTGREQSLSIASDRMRRLGIRHLPVVHDGVLCGVLSERDVRLAETLSAVEPAHLSVGAAMGHDLYAVAESTPLAHVVRTMSTHSYGCAVVMERGVVVGVFATNDVLRAASDLLEARGGEQEVLGASEARAVVMTEHAHVHALLLRVDRATHRLRESRVPERDADKVREQARHLRDAIRSYMELKERQLNPMLSNLSGSSKTCGHQLADEHIRLLADTASLASVLQDDDVPTSLAEQLERVLSNLRRDLEREHALLFALDSTSNDQVISDAAAD